MAVNTVRQTLSVLLTVGFVIFGRWYVTHLQPTPGNSVITSTVKNCPGQSLEQRVAAADVIVVAQVAMVVPGQKYAEVYLNPQQIYKGELVRPMRILAKSLSDFPTSSDQTFLQVRIDGRVENELSFASGQAPYLLFLHSSPDGYLTSRCDGSRYFGDGLTTDEQQALGLSDVVQ